MSYIPDYRTEKNEALLNDDDKAFLAAYRLGLEDGRVSFENALENLDRGDGAEDEALREEFETLLDISETEAVCSMFDAADYIPDDADLEDARKPLFHREGDA